MTSTNSSNQSKLREALTAGNPTAKEKGPPVADGVLSITPDSPDVLEWRSRSALDASEASSTFLDEEDEGGLLSSFLTLHLVSRPCSVGSASASSYM